MNIIDENSDQMTNQTKDQKILFDYNSKQLWPEEDIEEDMDYVPKPPDLSDGSENSAVDDILETSADQPVANHSYQCTNQTEDINGSVEDRIVAPIKISKNKRKNSKNWSIVSQKSVKTKQKNGFTGDINANGSAPKRRRGRQPKPKINGFIVTEVIDESHKPTPKKAKKSPTKECKTDRKRMERDYCKQKSVEDNDLVIKNKMSTKYQFNCLLNTVEHDFDQIIPNEILIKIFNIVLENDKNRTQSLINLSNVCESWRKLVIMTPLLWQSLDLQSFSDINFPYNHFFQLLKDNQLFSYIKSLSLNGWSGMNAERVLNTIATECRDNLLELSVKQCKNISPQFLQILSTFCPNLQVLDISAITFLRFIGLYVRRKKAASHQNNQSPFASAIFRPYLERCGHKLVSFNMSENTMPSFHSCIIPIMEFCQNLELLDISNVESLSKTASISIERLQTSCPKLRILRAANITFTSSTSGSQTVGFGALEELSIPFKSDFSTAIIQNAHTDNVLEQLTKNAENLKLLDIRGARYLSHRALVRIPAWNIQHLSISNCPKLNTEQLEMVFTKWNKSLIDVDISWNTSEESVNSCMKSLCEVGEQESQLRTLQLRGSAVSYESIKCLFKSCPKLESIDLQSCRGLPRGIKRTYSGAELMALKSEVFDGKYD